MVFFLRETEKEQRSRNSFKVKKVAKLGRI